MLASPPAPGSRVEEAHQGLGHVVGAGKTLTMIAAGMEQNDTSPARRNRILAAYGLGTTVGVLLPFSRTHESEAGEHRKETTHGFIVRGGCGPAAAG